MSTWNKETQLVSMYFGEVFMQMVDSYGEGFTPTAVRSEVQEQIMYNQEGLASELLLTSLNKVDWYDLVETYLAEAKETLVDEL
jgi:hypothetical protein